MGCGSSTYTDPESVEKRPHSAQHQPKTNSVQHDNPKGQNNNKQNENKPKDDNEETSNCIIDESKNKNSSRDINNQIQDEKDDDIGLNEPDNKENQDKIIHEELGIEVVQDGSKLVTENSNETAKPVCEIGEESSTLLNREEQEQESKDLEKESDETNDGFRETINTLNESIDEVDAGKVSQFARELKMKIIKGCFESASKCDSKTIRLFVSSTFTDTKAERNYLMRHIYPDIRDFCAARGVSFSVVDMRWGIRDEATNDHMTNDICMTEIEKCRRETIQSAPCFLYLGFNKYGYKPLPRTIEISEFKVILNNIDDENALSLINKWYKCDENNIPPIYILQPISVHIPEYLTCRDEERRSVIQQWYTVEEILKKSLSKAALISSELSDEQKNKWIFSVTHQEVIAGMLKPNGEENRSLCVMRNIPYLQQGQFQKDDIKFACRFIDMDRAVEPPVIDTNVKKLIGKLQDDTLKKCGNILKYDSIKWVQDGGVTEQTHQEYIKAMGKQVGKSLQGAIKRAIETTPDVDSVTQECASHLKFCYSRAHSFFGRVDLIDEGLKYFKVNGEVTRVPLVVHGISGAGKTSLMAALAYRGIKQIDDSSSSNPVLVVRFCGTTPLSSSGRVLLKSICDQIKEAFDDGQPSPPISYAYADLIVEFKRQIGCATAERPIVILIDSLDQLNDDDFARTEPVWIPTQLPPHVYLAVSTLPNIGGSYKYLKTTNISEVEVVPLNLDDARNILSAWLKISKRTLTKSQLNTVLSVATDSTTEQPTALRLRLLCDAVVGVESYSNLPELPNTVTGLINAFFERLEVYHGKELIQTCFGLLSTARFGLSESELIDLLSCDDNVMDAVLQYHKPPEKRLPFVVFARLMNDIKDYVSIRGGLGKNAMTWYHRQFIEASERTYKNKNLLNLSNHLSKYFDNTFSKEFPDRGIAPQPLYWKSNDGESEGRINLSAVAELPAALMAGQRRKRCVEVLADPVFLSAKCYAGFGRDLVGDLFDLKDTLSNFVMMIPNDEDRAMDSKDDTINDLAEFIRSQMNILEKNTELFVQQGMDQIKSTIARSLIEKYQTKDGGLLPWVPNGIKRPLVEHINKYQDSHPCAMTLDGHTAPVTAVSLQMIKGQAIISASEDGSVRLWDRKTGRQIGKMTTKSSIRTMSITELPSSKIYFNTSLPCGTAVFVGCEDGSVYVWRVAFSYFKGKEPMIVPISIFQAFNDTPVQTIAVESSVNDKDCSRIVTGSCYTLNEEDGGQGEVKLWDISELLTVQSGDELREPIFLSMKTRHEIAIAQYGNKEWNVGIKALAYSPDNAYIAVGFGLPTYMSGKGEILGAVVRNETLETACVIDGGNFQLHYLEFDKNYSNGETYRLLISTPYTFEVCLITPSKGNNNNRSAMLFEKLDSNHSSGAFTTTENIYGSAVASMLLLWKDSQKFEFKAHGGPLKTVDFGNAGITKLCVTGAADSLVKVWDVDKCFEYEPPDQLHNFSCTALGIDPQQGVIVTGGDRGSSIFAELRSWNSRTGEMITYSNGFSDKLTNIQYCPCSRLCCVRKGENNQILVYGMSTFVNASHGFDGRSAKINTITVSENKETHKRYVAGRGELSFTPDCAWLVSNSPSSRDVKIYSVSEIGRKNGDKTDIALGSHNGDTMGGHFSDSGRYLITWCADYTNESKRSYDDAPQPRNSELKLWERKAGPEFNEVKCVEADKTRPSVGTINPHRGHHGFSCARISPDGAKLAVGTRTGQLQVRSIPSLDIIANTTAHENDISSAKFSPDGELLVTGSMDKWVSLWNSSNLDRIWKYYVGCGVTSLEVYIIDKVFRIACGDTSGRMNVLEVNNVELGPAHAYSGRFVHDDSPCGFRCRWCGAWNEGEPADDSVVNCQFCSSPIHHIGQFLSEVKTET